MVALVVKKKDDTQEGWMKNGGQIERVVFS